MRTFLVTFNLLNPNKKIQFICIEFEFFDKKMRFEDYSTGETLEYKAENVENLKIIEL